MFYALKDGKLEYNDRIAQFDIQTTPIKDFNINFVDHLKGSDRGGYGSTGVK